MSTSTNVATDTTLFMLRIISPSFVLFTAISLLTIRPLPRPSLSPLTGVTQAVSVRIPRRCLILSCLSFSSFIHVFDGLAFVIYAVINKRWPQDTGTEINALIGLVAFSSLAALGTWKDINGVDVWLLKRMKILIFLSLIFDVTHEVLYGTSMPKNCTNTSLHATQRNLICRFNRPPSSLLMSVRDSSHSSFYSAIAHSSSCPIILCLDQSRCYRSHNHV
jgi:hypothetical protein